MLRTLVFFVCLASTSLWAGSAYVGSETCSGCHKAEHSAWLQSHHAKAMELPDEQSVKGDFNNATFSFEGVSSRFFVRDKQYFIEVTEADKSKREYPVAYTFGFYPLQQYLLLTEKGHYQAYDVAWDARPKTEGGQRWYKLLPDMDTGPDSSFHWSRQLNNWNSRCADCHSTGLVKGFDQSDLSYNTRFAEINVACESCHGAGDEHVAMAKSGTLSKTKSGFATQFNPALPFQFAAGEAIAKAKDKTAALAIQQSQINACGGCHSRRQPIAAADPAKNYHDQYRITLLQDPIYFANGDVQDEAFVLGSFMQSKMFQAGVTCTHCHDPHSGQVKLQGNLVCTQCHAADVFDSEKHHKLETGAAGSLCFDCHMPDTVFMGVDARRDHRFSIPGQTASTPGYAQLNTQARLADPLWLRDITRYVMSAEQPDIRRATLLELTGTVPSRLTLETITQAITSDNALVRRAAVDASDFLNLEMRWQIFSPLLDDPAASVRYSVATLLAPLSPHLQGADAVKLSTALEQYQRQLDLSADAPSGQAMIASLESAKGDTAAAIKALQTALKLEPDYLPAWLNLADIYRGSGQAEEEKRCLDQAMAIDADNAGVLHAYGLYLVRQKRIEDALQPLQKATETEPTTVQFFYVYAVALESSGDIGAAIDVLKQANERWPNQYNVLMVLIQYLEKSGREAESYPYLSVLSSIAPSDPAVQQRVQKLKQ